MRTFWVIIGLLVSIIGTYLGIAATKDWPPFSSKLIAPFPPPLQTSIRTTTATLILTTTQTTATTSTAILVITPSNPPNTYTSTIAETNTISATNTPIPTPTPTPIPTINGQVASDIPGTILNINNSYKSLVDKNTKPRDVYAVTLTAGQQVQFSISDASNTNWLYFRLANPSSGSFAANSLTFAYQTDVGSGWSYKFTPALTGTYYVGIGAYSSGQAYTLSIITTGQTFGNGTVANDIPGTAFYIGISQSSVVDKNTKPRDVYAVTLTAGQQVQFSISDASNTNWLYFRLANPSSGSFTANSLSFAYQTDVGSGWSYKFTPALTGTYYVGIGAYDSGQAYTLSIITTEQTFGNGTVANDVPGTVFNIGVSQSSVVDKNTKPRDVYAVTLTAGQQVQFSISDASNTNWLYFRLANPSSGSFAANSLTFAYQTDVGSGWSYKFTPALTGTYYVGIGAYSSGQAYTLSIITTGQTFGNGTVANDVPGTVFNIGVSQSSVVDKNTKPRDVYAVTLTAGQQVQFSISDASNTNWLYFRLANPSSGSFAENTLTFAYQTDVGSGWSYKFTPALTGTYYVGIGAYSSGQAYTLSIITTGQTSNILNFDKNKYNWYVDTIFLTDSNSD